MKIFEDEFEFKDSKFTKFSCTGNVKCEINVYGCMFVMIVGDMFLSMPWTGII
jgi:hypothetical protein